MRNIYKIVLLIGLDVKREAKVDTHIGYTQHNTMYTPEMVVPKMSAKWLAAILAVAIAAISTASIFIRYAQSEGVPSSVIAALRLSIATSLLAPFVLGGYRNELRGIRPSQLAFVTGAGIFLAIHFSAWISSLEFTSIASSALFVSTGPVWVAILSPLLLNEKVSRIALAGILLAIAGGITIGLVDACSALSAQACLGAIQKNQDNGVLRGNFLALMGAWAVSGYLMVGRKARAGMSLIPYVFLVYGVAALALTVFLISNGISVWNYSQLAYLWIFLLAAIPQLVGHSTLNWALKFMPASLVSVVTLCEPIGAAILAFLLFQESLHPISIFGGALILLGIFLATRTPK